MFRIIVFYLIILPTFVIAQEFTYSGEKIKTEISNAKNRISMNLAIAQIVGDESQYNIILDKKNKNIFLTPKVEIGESLELSLIDLSGHVVDLELTVKAIESQLIKINPRNIVAQNTDTEPLQMMRAMLSNKGDKYFVTEMQRNLGTINGLDILQIKSYKYGQWVGAELLVTNSLKKPVILTESDFSSLFASVAINIQKLLLSPKAKARVIIITVEPK